MTISRYSTEHEFPRSPNDSPDYPGEHHLTKVILGENLDRGIRINRQQARVMACVEIRPDRNSGAVLVGFDARDFPVFERHEYGSLRRNATNRGGDPTDPREPILPLPPDHPSRVRAAARERARSAPQSALNPSGRVSDAATRAASSEGGVTGRAVLEDSEVAVVIDCLAMGRDKLNEDGYPTPTIESALGKVTSIITPGTFQVYLEGRTADYGIEGT